MPDQLVTYADVQAAHARVAPYTHYTPLLTCQSIDELATQALCPPPPIDNGGRDDGQRRSPRVRIAFKAEHLQRVGAFKYRGATNAILVTIERLQADAERAGDKRPFDPSRLVVVTHSSGNHAAALACAARTAGAVAAIVMPETAPKPKVDAVKGYGARITFCKPTLEARESTAATVMKEYEEQGYTVRFVHPYDEPLVIAGQGTMALEMLDQARGLERRGGCSAAAATQSASVQQPASSQLKLHGVRGAEPSGPKAEGVWRPRRPDEPVFDIVIAPVGGGGMLSGVATAVKGGDDRIIVIGAEPDLVDDAFHSVQQGTVTSPPQPPKTICDGLLTSLSPLTLSHISQRVDTISTVEEVTVLRALKLHWERQKQLVEPSAAVGLGSVLQGFNAAARKAGLDESGEDRRAWGVKQWVDEIVARRREQRGADDEQQDEIRIGIVWSGGNIELAKVLAQFAEHGL